mmetsp:Transcript_48396/g.104879  ORF Transcript_48396/g.104879 Transcript_48396/m.104879 type:complete len:214 (+) Transcript_48396:407-1048(+)|eukprot:6183035-Pleurochrysis_carterae.AAC.2
MVVALDHIFVFTTLGAARERAYLASLGLQETYSRVHPGQGTENVCYAFRSMYLELLWLTDKDEAESSDIRRTGLAARSEWRTQSTSPFGFAWRPAAEHPCSIWQYRPPYLPKDTSIPVAVESDDASHPFVFGTPGGIPPCNWDSGRQRGLQMGGGFDDIAAVTLYSPVTCGPGLTAMERAGALRILSAESWLLELEISRIQGDKSLHLKLPLC